MWQISRIIGFGFLAGLTAEDIRTRKVSEELLIMMSILAAGYQIWTKEISWNLIISGLGIGLVFLFVSYVTRESLGYGDSILICILGLFVGGMELIEILVIAWLGAAVVSMILLLRRKFGKKLAVPFVPFLSLGYSVVSICTYLAEYSGVAG